MTTTVYSFSDINMVINFPGFPAYTVGGQGVGSIAINYPNDNTVHDLAADGSVMVSKVKADNCNISISMQQTSLLHQWMLGVFNFLMNAASSRWASGNITISSPGGAFSNIVLSSVSFTKRADQPFEQQGQKVNWALMAAGGQSIGSTLAAISQPNL